MKVKNGKWVYYFNEKFYEIISMMEKRLSIGDLIFHADTETVEQIECKKDIDLLKGEFYYILKPINFCIVLTKEDNILYRENN